MYLLEILLLIGLVWLASEVARLRARVSDLERLSRSPPRDGEVAARRADGGGGALGARQADVGPRDEPPPPRASGAWSPSPSRGGSTLERLVGGRLLIWVGGAALALGGLFLVRYSIEVGLIGPGVRMLLTAALGLLFLGGGEAARARMADEPRVAQALVGAGVLVLYAAAYAAHLLYGFYGVSAAFALMALVAAGGLALSLRHGWPAAALGLVGGLATPALVGEAGAVAPLLGYLLLLNAAVLWAARARGWSGLLGAAVLGTAGWTAALAVSAEGGEAIAVGLFALGYALAATAVLERGGPEPRTGVAGWLARLSRPAALGLAQLALLVAAQDYAGWAWLLYGALAAAVLAWSRADRLPWLPAGAAAGAAALLWLHGLTPERSNPWLIALGIAVLFAGVAAWRLGRGDARPVWVLTLAIATLGLGWVLRGGPITSFDLSGPAWGALWLGLALPSALLARTLRSSARAQPSFDGRLVGLAATAATAAGAGALDALTETWAPTGLALVALLLAGVGRALGDAGVGRVAAVAAAVALLASAVRIGAAPDWPGAGEATALLAVPGALLAGAALLTREAALRQWLWAGAGLAGLAWAGVLARQLEGLARVLSFLALGGALVAAGTFWGRRRAAEPSVVPASAGTSKSSAAGSS